MKLDRRELLFSGTAALAVGLAGCAAERVDDAEDNESDGNETADNESDADETDENESDGNETADNESDDGFGTTEDEDNETDETNNESPENETDETNNETDGENETDDETNETDETGEDDDDADDGSDDVEEPPVSEITIRVTDTEGTPVEEAIIHGRGEAHEADIPLEFTGETGADGVHATPIYQNAYEIEIRHSNFESVTVEHVHDGDTELSVELDPRIEEPPTSEIRVRVVDASGSPIPGASVSGVGDPHPADIPLEFDGETNESGVLATPIYQNSYEIEVDHPDYGAETVEHVHDGDTEVTVELQSAVEEPPTSELTFTVTDRNGQPVEGATVSGVGEMHPAGIAREFDGETDENGVYVTLIYENAYEIEIDHPDYMLKTIEYEFTGDDEIEVELWAGDGESALAVEAVHPVSGEPVPGVTVSVTPTNGNGPELVAETGSDGVATFTVGDDEYRIVAYGRDLHRSHPWARTVVVEEPTMVAATAAVEPEDCTGRIEVVDGAGDPIEGADVEVAVDRPDHDLLTDSRAETRENGIAEITTWCGDWEITAREGDRRATETFFVDTSSPETLVLEL